MTDYNSRRPPGSSGSKPGASPEVERGLARVEEAPESRPGKSGKSVALKTNFGDSLREKRVRMVIYAQILSPQDQIDLGK